MSALIDLTESPPPSPRGKEAPAQAAYTRHPPCIVGTPPHTTDPANGCTPTAVLDLTDPKRVRDDEDDDDVRFIVDVAGPKRARRDEDRRGEAIDDDVCVLGCTRAETVDLLCLSDSDDEEEDGEAVEDLRRLGAAVVDAADASGAERAARGAGGASSSSSRPPNAPAPRGSGVGYGGKGRGSSGRGGRGDGEWLERDTSVLESQVQADAALAAALAALSSRLTTYSTAQPRVPLGRSARVALEGAARALHALALNESRDDWSRRVGLYVAATDLASALSARAALAGLVIDPPPHSTRSVADALAVMAAQGRTFAEMCEGRIGTMSGADRKVIDAVEATCSKLAGAVEKRTARPARRPRLRGAEARYAAAMRPELFASAPLAREHYFRVSGGKRGAGWSQRTVGGEVERKRSQRIAREMSELSTALPCHLASTVLVRVDEEDHGMLRALILPPCDTPYGGGAFEFDIYLPPQYPSVCPQVQFLTTGGGKVRFNPNLYNNGKVCLSLLGTWAGPKWDPKHSTLLQVLVSIQSMIFCEDPYFNEPGYERTSNSKQGKIASRKYNEQIQLYTITHAVIPALRRVLSNGGSGHHFGEALKKHYEFKSVEIEDMLARWMAERRECGESGGKGAPAWLLNQISEDMVTATGHNWNGMSPAGRADFPTVVKQAREALEALFQCKDLQKTKGGGGTSSL